MEISAIPINTVPVSNILRVRYSRGRILMPVRRNQSWFARFKHVSGFPAPSGNRGLSLRKLRSLDAIIDRLVKIKGEKQTSPQGENVRGLDPESLDVLIEQYARELHTEMVRVKTPYTLPGTQSGLMFNMLA
ncbi:MAG: hypothetical protein KAU17_01340 [Spirochaetales bacterium]|nr:hypothetical protein [Spirochaetales bacterium]